MPDRFEGLLRLVCQYIFHESLPLDAFSSIRQSKLREIAKEVSELSSIYTSQRQHLSRSLLQDPRRRKAYLAYFLLCNLSKFKIILAEIVAHPKVRLKRKLRFMDVGCGPGTHLLGLLDFLADRPQSIDSLHCVAVDSVRANLQDADALFASYYTSLKYSQPFPDCSLQAFVGELSHPLKTKVDGKYDFIVIGNVLNELFRENKNPVVRRCDLVCSISTEWLAADGFLILIEPALKETSRGLLHVRDLLLEKSDLRIYSPCVHSLPCPAVGPGNFADWCHEDRAWTAPEVVRRIDAMVGNRKNSLKYSYVVLNRMGYSVKDTAVWRAPTRGLPIPNSLRCSADADKGGTTSQASPEIWRVVSESMPEKGKSSCFLCGVRGRMKVTRLEKHCSGLNKEFEQFDRGQVVLTQGLESKTEKDWRVNVSTQVKRLI